MTRNQIEYWNMKESIRHNKATEQETNRHNVQSETVDLGNLNENIRHNKSVETETRRHNKVGETESNRHNLETERQGRDVIAETGRHNLETERQGRDIIAETGRHNRATEGIDLGKLNETIRHNVVTEGQEDRRIDLSMGQLSEQQRHNLVSEGQTAQDITNRKEQTEINRFAAESQAQVNNANARLTNLKADWEGILNSEHISVSEDQRREYKAKVEEAQAVIDKLKQETRNMEIDEFNKEYDLAERIIQSISDLIDSIIPG